MGLAATPSADYAQRFSSSSRCKRSSRESPATAASSDVSLVVGRSNSTTRWTRVLSIAPGCT